MNGHHDRLMAILNLQKHSRELQCPALSRSNFAEFLDVRPGDKGLAAADEHGRFDAIVRADLLNGLSDSFRDSRT